MLIGTSVAQLIPIGVAPLLTRLFSPAEFGVLALFVSIAKVISTFSTGRYEPAIVLPESDKDAMNIAIMSFIFLIAGVTLFFGVTMLFHDWILELLNNPDFGLWLYIAPLSALLMGAWQILFFWHSRKKKYKVLSSGKIIQGISTAGIQSSSGLIGQTGVGLVLGNILGQVLLVAWYLRYFVGYYKSNRLFLSKTEMVKNAKIYKDFPLVTSMHVFFDLLKNNGLIYMISSFFSSKVLGCYSLTTRILLTPSAIVGEAIRNVFYQKASENFNQKKPIAPLLRKVFVVLLGLSAPVFLILFLFATDIFLFVFGKEWEVAGVYTRILTPWLFLNFISSPVSGIVYILNKQKLFFLISAIGNTLAITSFGIAAILTKSVESSLTIFSAIMSLYTIVYLYFLYDTIVKSDHSLR
ncbi:MAG: O-antigen/teichoic acid export membrane protein [Saprospiraceae bacterium]|jgi:O-antigen/teichoic acid export membrane protein